MGSGELDFRGTLLQLVRQCPVLVVQCGLSLVRTVALQ